MNHNLVPDKHHLRLNTPDIHTETFRNSLFDFRTDGKTNRIMSIQHQPAHLNRVLFLKPVQMIPDQSQTVDVPES